MTPSHRQGNGTSRRAHEASTGEVPATRVAPGRSREDAGSARERILEAADDLFGQLGFDAAPTRLIAERSGVNKALIHYHYSTKDELFGAVLDRYYERLAAAVRPALEAPGAPRAKLLGVVDAYVDFLSGHQTFHRLVQREIAGERHLERILGHTLPLFAAGTAALQVAWPRSTDGDLRAADLLISFHGMIISSFTYAPVVGRLSGADPLSPEELTRRKAHLHRMAELVMDALEAGVQAVPTGARPRARSKSRSRIQ